MPRYVVEVVAYAEVVVEARSWREAEAKVLKNTDAIEEWRWDAHANKEVEDGAHNR
jgi:hypothetical protein